MSAIAIRLKKSPRNNEFKHPQGWGGEHDSKLYRIYADQPPVQVPEALAKSLLASGDFELAVDAPAKASAIDTLTQQVEALQLQLAQLLRPKKVAKVAEVASEAPPVMEPPVVKTPVKKKKPARRTKPPVSLAGLDD